jgi:hypothetical protein
VGAVFGGKINRAVAFYGPSSGPATQSSSNKRLATSADPAHTSPIGKRALADPLEYSRELAVFNAHFLLGGDWKICCRQLKIDRGTSFHTVYRVEEILGRVFAETRPYALWPVAEYFGFRLPGGVKPCPVPAPVRRDNGPVRPPLAAPQPVAHPAGVPVPVVPDLVPSIVNVPAHIRARFRSGSSLRVISAEMVRLNVPAPRGSEAWGVSTVRRILLDKAA